MAYFTPTLASFKALRVLTLDIMIEGYQFLSPTTTFPLLETLYIGLSNAYCSTDSKYILDNVLTPFLNNHNSTLRVFKLSSLRTSYTFDIPSLLLKLRHFPRLKTFSLWHPFVSIRQSNSAGLSHILRLHSEHLLELSLHAKGPIQYSMYPTADQWYAQEFLRANLPKLQVLDLDIELYPDINQTTAFLSRFQKSLTSLKLSVNTLSHEDVKHIAETFSTQDRLRELCMSVGVLNPQLFALFAEKLPSLETLFLEFSELVPSNLDEDMLWDSSVSNFRLDIACPNSV
ncbi:hypothetical protein H0H87_000373 [Tephrocybe sp. NHM501043]|nr:hypothetical protein H0H87_000373 [Tephrocybe sp. NHM501043]